MTRIRTDFISVWIRNLTDSGNTEYFTVSFLVLDSGKIRTLSISRNDAGILESTENAILSVLRHLSSK